MKRKTPHHLLKKLHLLELKIKGLVETSSAGNFCSIFKGAGINFEAVRPYIPGDEIFAIDWNVTARVGEPHVKIFNQEREMSVMIVADMSASGKYGSTPLSKIELTQELIALIGWSALQNNDAIGLLLFTENVEYNALPKKGKTAFFHLINDLISFVPKYSGTNLNAALEFINRRLMRRSLIFVISDFLSENWLRSFTVTAKKHDVIAISLIDPVELELPDVGTVLLEDPETGESIEIDTSLDSVRRDYAKSAEERIDTLKLSFQRLGVDFSIFPTHENIFKLMKKILSLRIRKRII